MAGRGGFRDGGRGRGRGRGRGGRGLEDYQVVAVDDFAFVFVAELGREPAGGAAYEGRDLLGVVVDQAPGDQAAGLGGQVDRVACLEGAVYAGDARREEGGAADGDGLDGAVVELEGALGHRRVGQPEQPGAGPVAGGGEVGAGRPARQRGGGVGGGRDDGGDAGPGRDQGRVDLGRHAARADAGLPGPARPDLRQVLGPGHHVNPAGAAPAPA